MMKAGRIAILLGLCVLGLVLMMVSRGPTGSSERSETPAVDVRTPHEDDREGQVALSRRPLSRSVTDSRVDAAHEKPGILAGLNDELGTIEQDLAIVDNLLFSYHSVYHEFPYGENADWVKIFRGANPRRISFLSDSEGGLNEKDQLIDRWGTPFYFHRVSGSRIEIRSAGPDGLHWTEDDFSSMESGDATIAGLSLWEEPTVVAD